MLGLDVKPLGVIRARGAQSFIEVAAPYRGALLGLASGDRVQVLYWMHGLTHHHRRCLQIHPRGDPRRPARGVFSLRSCTRPNPIGVSEVGVVELREDGLVVEGLDAQDGSVLLDVKSACPFLLVDAPEVP